MKKILLTFLVISTLSSYHISEAADPSCLIEDAPAPILSEYIKNNRIIIKNISKGIGDAKKDTNSLIKSGNYSQGVISRTFNKIINWNTYFSYFNYYIIFPVANDVPYQIKRDYKMLDAENERLSKYFKSLAKKGYLNIEIDSACTGIENCELSGEVNEIMGKLIQNNSNILDLYRKTVMPEGLYNGTFRGEIILVGDSNTFKEELEKYYGSGDACVEAKGKFKEKITKLKDKIIETSKGSDKGIQNWKDAWALVNDWGGGIDTQEEKELERNLLAQELARQGVPSDAASATIGALDNFNEEGFSPSTLLNPIVNTYKYLKNNITEQYNNFKKDVFDDLANERKNGSEESARSINALLNDDKQNNIDLRIASSIAELYYSQIPIAAETQIQTSSIEARMTQLHNNLNLSIKTLTEASKNAVTVCNQQDKGNGNCGKIE